MFMARSSDPADGRRAELPRSSSLCVASGFSRKAIEMLKFLARRRVPLGFLAGIAALWLVAIPRPAR